MASLDMFKGENSPYDTYRSLVISVWNPPSELSELVLAAYAFQTNSLYGYPIFEALYHLHCNCYDVKESLRQYLCRERCMQQIIRDVCNKALVFAYQYVNGPIDVDYVQDYACRTYTVPFAVRYSSMLAAKTFVELVDFIVLNKLGDCNNRVNIVNIAIRTLPEHYHTIFPIVHLNENVNVKDK